MSHKNIIHAWKDEEYRRNLTDFELARLPENPAGTVDLTEMEMLGVGGGAGYPHATFLCPLHSLLLFTYGCCDE